MPETLLLNWLANCVWLINFLIFPFLYLSCIVHSLKKFFFFKYFFSFFSLILCDNNTDSPKCVWRFLSATIVLIVPLFIIYIIFFIRSVSLVFIYFSHGKSDFVFILIDAGGELFEEILIFNCFDCIDFDLPEKPRFFPFFLSTLQSMEFSIKFLVFYLLVTTEKNLKTFTDNIPRFWFWIFIE